VVEVETSLVEAALRPGTVKLNNRHLLD